MMIGSGEDFSLPKRVLRSTASNYAGQFAALVSGFLLTPFVLHSVGPQDYGLWVLVGSVLSYGSLLDLGISGAVVKYVAEYRARGDNEEAHRLIATSLALYMVLGLVAIALSGLLAFLVPGALGLSADHQRLARSLILLAGLGMGINLPSLTVGAVLRGIQRFDIANLIGTTGILLSALSTLVVLSQGGGLLGLVAIGIATTIVMQVPSIWFVNRLAPELRFGWRGARRNLVRKVFSVSSSVAIVQVAGLLTVRADALVIGAVLKVGAVTPYALTQRLGQTVELLTKQFIKVILPLASERSARREEAALRRLYLTTTRLTLAASIPVAISVAVFAPELLSVWVGDQYAKYSSLVVLFTINAVIDTMLWPAWNVLMGMERHRVPAFMAIGNGISNLVLSLVLVRYFGLTGVAIGTLAPTILEAFVFFIPYTMRSMRVTLAESLKEVYAPMFTLIVLMTTMLLLAKRTVHPASPLSLLVVIAGTTVIYAMAYVALGASRAERSFYSSIAAGAGRHVIHPFKRS